MALIRDSFCSWCGAQFPPPLRYPRECPRCKTVAYANPIPVSVVLQPVEVAGRTGLLVIRRAMDPARGKLGLVGGFVEEHESWQVGGAREVQEEAGLTIDPQRLRPFWFASSDPRPNRVLLFSVGEEVPVAQLPSWQPNDEATERGVVLGPGGLDEVFAFSTHVEAARRFFAERGERGAHDYTAL